MKLDNSLNFKYYLILFIIISVFIINDKSYSFPEGINGLSGTNQEGCYCHTAKADSTLEIKLIGSNQVNFGVNNKFTIQIKNYKNSEIAGIDIALRKSLNGYYAKGLVPADNYLHLVGNDLSNDKKPNQKYFKDGIAEFDFYINEPEEFGDYYIQATVMAANGDGINDLRDYWNIMTPVKINVTSENPIIKIITPNKDLKIPNMTGFWVKWTSSKVKYVNIDLINTYNGKVEKNLASYINANTKVLAVDPDKLLGTGYKLKISDSENPSVFALSDYNIEFWQKTKILGHNIEEYITLCANNDYEYFVNAIGQNLKYQWYRNEEAIEGAIFSRFTPSEVGYYYCIITSDYDKQIKTNVSSLNFEQYPNVYEKSPDISVSVGESAYFSVKLIEGYSNYNYYWYKKSNPNYKIYSYNKLSLTIYNVSINDTGIYVCHIDGICKDYDFEFKLDVYEKIKILSQPNSNFNPCQDEDIILKISAKGTKIKYQWYLNDSLLFNQNDSTLKLLKIQESNSGNYYCKIFNSKDTLISQKISVNVYNKPIITKQSNDTTIYFAETIRLFIDLKDSYSVKSFLWKKDGKTVYTSSNVCLVEADSFDKQGKYECIITNNCGETTSKEIKLTIIDYPDTALLKKNTKEWLIDPIIPPANSSSKVFKGAIKNIGKKDLEIYNILISSYTPSDFEIVNPKRLTIKPNDSADIEVKYSGKNINYTQACIKFVSNSYRSDSILIYGCLANLMVESNKTFIDFYNNLSMSFYLYNSGNITITLLSYELTGTNKSNFKVTTAMPVYLYSGSSKEIIVTRNNNYSKNEADLILNFNYNIPSITVKLKSGIFSDVNSENSNANIYPNPANDFIYYKINENVDLNLIKIIDLIGEEYIINKIDKIDNNYIKIDVSNLQSGIYFIKTENEIKKFIKR